jgi:hypothetical protein
MGPSHPPTHNGLTTYILNQARDVAASIHAATIGGAPDLAFRIREHTKSPELGHRASKGGKECTRLLGEGDHLRARPVVQHECVIGGQQPLPNHDVLVVRVVEYKGAHGVEGNLGVGVECGLGTLGLETTREARIQTRVGGWVQPLHKLVTMRESNSMCTCNIYNINYEYEVSDLQACCSEANEWGRDRTDRYFQTNQWKFKT